MEIPEDAVRLRIFIGETQTWHHQPLFEAIVNKALEMNLGGSTVLKGLLGYGKTKRLPTDMYLDAMTNLPFVVEIVDSEEKIKAFLPVADQMTSSGRVTREKAKVLHYRGTEPATRA